MEFQALTINDSTIKVDNRTDYYLDQWLYSDYGFRLFYRPTRGIQEVYWNDLLDKYDFDDYRVKRKGFIDLETRERSLDFHEFIGRNFSIEFVSANSFYNVLFDRKDWILLVTNESGYWNNL